MTVLNLISFWRTTSHCFLRLNMPFRQEKMVLRSWCSIAVRMSAFLNTPGWLRGGFLESKLPSQKEVGVSGTVKDFQKRPFGPAPPGRKLLSCFSLRAKRARGLKVRSLCKPSSSLPRRHSSERVLRVFWGRRWVFWAGLLGYARIQLVSFAMFLVIFN